MIHLAFALAIVLAPTQAPSSQPQAQTQKQDASKWQIQEDRPKLQVTDGWSVATLAENLPPAGPPRLIDSALFDGGFNNIDKGVLLTYGPTGNRFEVWEVQKNVNMDHALVLAFDPDGAELWRTKFQWASGDTWWNALASTVDGAGDLYFMYITMGGGSSYKWRIVKVTQAGVAWQKTLYTTTWGKEPTFMAPHPQGGVVVLSAASGQVRDLYTARISSAGDLLWEKKYDVAGENQFPNALVVAGDGSIHVVGDDDTGMHVRKYKADGAVLWTRTLARNTQYERPKGRLAYLDTSGDLVVAGSTYAGGNDPDWLFVNKYDPQGASLLSFVSHLSQAEGKISDYGLAGGYAARGGDGAVYFAWDDTDKLDSAWFLRRVVVPVRAPPSDPPRMVKVGEAPPLQLFQNAQVSWTKSFTADKAMNVERLMWIGNGAIGVLGRGKRKLGTNDYRADTRLRAIGPDGVDFGAAVFGSPGNFNNEPVAAGIGRGAMIHVLGWQYYSGDGWNDENVMRLRFQLKYTPPPN